MTVIRNMVKGATFPSESILCSVEKSDMVRSIALANTREDRNDSSIMHKRNSAVENAKVCWLLSKVVQGTCRMSIYMRTQNLVP